MFENDPFGPIKPDQQKNNLSAREVDRLHENADTDASTLAIHHTLGVKHNQAAPGDHTHEVVKVGRGAGLSISGSRGGNAAVMSLITMLQQVIDFTDNTTA